MPTKSDVREKIASIVIKHMNAMFRELEQYYGVVHLNQTEAKSYKSALSRIHSVLFRAVASEYYDFGGRRY